MLGCTVTECKYNMNNNCYLKDITIHKKANTHFYNREV